MSVKHILLLGALFISISCFFQLTVQAQHPRPYQEYKKKSWHEFLEYSILSGDTAYYLFDSTRDRVYILWLIPFNGKHPDKTNLPKGFSFAGTVHQTNKRSRLKVKRHVRLLNDDSGNTYVRIH